MSANTHPAGPGRCLYKSTLHTLSAQTGESGHGAYVSVGNALTYLTDHELIIFATSILDDVAERLT